MLLPIHFGSQVFLQHFSDIGLWCGFSHTKTLHNDRPGLFLNSFITSTDSGALPEKHPLMLESLNWRSSSRSKYSGMWLFNDKFNLS